MSFPNDQGNPAAAVPVWLDVAPVADAQGRYPNDPRISGGAIPVYIVGGPGLYPIYGNDQGQAIAAVPVRICSQPSSTGPLSTDPALDSSAIPVWNVEAATPEASAYPNSQGDARAAIPVWIAT